MALESLPHYYCHFSVSAYFSRHFPFVVVEFVPKGQDLIARNLIRQNL